MQRNLVVKNVYMLLASGSIFEYELCKTKLQTTDLMKKFENLYINLLNNVSVRFYKF